MRTELPISYTNTKPDLYSCIDDLLTGQESHPDRIEKFKNIFQNNYNSFGTDGGTLLLNKYSTRTRTINKVRSALEKIEIITDIEKKQLAIKILNNIQADIELIHNYTRELNHLPDVGLFACEDNTILIEWIFDNYRIAFSLEDNINQSFWYLVSNEKYGNINCSGIIIDNNINNIISWLLNFIIDNSEL